MADTADVRVTAQVVLGTYTALRGSDTRETDIVDLIADLLILAAHEGMDPLEISESAVGHALGDMDPSDPFYVAE